MNNNETANGKKREWVKNLLAMSADEKAQQAFQSFQAEFNGKLYDYSFGNWFGLCIQAWLRGSTSFQFGSFNKWKSLGRFVKKGEKGMAVLVPVPVTKEVLNRETGKTEIKKSVFFTVKNGVFSLDQTEGKAGEVFTSFRTVDNYVSGMFESLLAIVEKKYPVRYSTLDTTTGGYTDGKEIVLNKERSIESQMVTLVHETAHCVLDHASEDMRAKLNSGERELEAELACLIYCTLAGVEAKGSAYYLRDVDFDTVDMTRINRAIKGATSIYELVHPKAEKKIEVA